MSTVGELIIRGLALGVGLAMDAFAVSMSNGLKDSKMNVAKALLIALTFALFQGVMPYIGYLLGHVFISYIEKFIPIIALVLLSFLGIKMIVDSIKSKKDKEDSKEYKGLTIKLLLIQAVATSIDALSTGITFADSTYLNALLCVSIIAVVTFIICILGVYIGKKFGVIFANKADIIGGVILIIIGLEIFIKGMGII